MPRPAQPPRLPVNPSRRQALATLTALASLAAVPAGAAALDEDFAPQRGRRGKDVMWLPTPDEIIDRLMRMAAVTPQDRLVDLGAGDGRILIAAARDFGVPGRGVEFDPKMVEFAQRQAQQAGVEALVTFEEGDIFKTDFSEATVVALYLLPELNLRLRPLLMAMPAGTRVVAHQFDMGRWTPDETSTINHREGYLWIVPANATGVWALRYADGQNAQLDFQQRFQRVAGTATFDTLTTTLRQPSLSGEHLRFALTDPAGTVWTFEARITGSVMQGEAHTADGRTVPFRAERTGQAPMLDGAQAPTDDELHAAMRALDGQ